MATETHENGNTTEINPSLQTGLAMIGGAGIVTMIAGAMIGVVLPDVDSAAIGLLILAGGGALIAAIAGWVGVVQPYTKFDDITQPMYHGHHHDEPVPPAETVDDTSLTGEAPH